MSVPNGKVTLSWGDGEHDFNLARIGQLLELEDKCGAGVMEVFTRLQGNRWRLNDVRETVRLGLIGGGQKPEAALVLVKRYVDERPLSENVLVATAILMAAIVGVPGDDVGKPPADRTATEEAGQATAVSSAPPSTASPPPSAGHPDKPTSSPSGSLPPVSTATTSPMAASPSRKRRARPSSRT